MINLLYISYIIFGNIHSNNKCVLINVALSPLNFKNVYENIYFKSVYWSNKAKNCLKNIIS